MAALWLFFCLFFTSESWGKETKIPYLGPGADKLSADEYQRIYKNYIQNSILLGYAFLKEPASRCDQALSGLFREAGMFGYPVPNDAQQISRSIKSIRGKKVETYESAGWILQLVRDLKSGAFEKLFLLNSSSPKASRKLSQLAKREILSLKRDPVTGLEEVDGVPVGYPHAFLTSESQGLFVKELRFNGQVEGCEPLGYEDNAWTQGFDLSQERCEGLRADATRVWDGSLAADAFAKRELDRLKETARKSLVQQGKTESQAKELLEQNFVPPFTSEINIVGAAMRNLARCNLLALGTSLRPKSDGGSSGAKPGAGSAK